MRRVMVGDMGNLNQRPSDLVRDSAARMAAPTATGLSSRGVSDVYLRRRLGRAFRGALTDPALAVPTVPAAWRQLPRPSVQARGRSLR